MNIINAEFYKLRKSTPFWACLFVCAVFAALLPFALQYAAASGEEEFAGLPVSALDFFFFSFKFPTVTLITALFVSIFVSGEFHNGTMKNYVSKGFRRGRIFITKYLACAAAVTAMLAVYTAAEFISGTVFFGFYPGVFSPGTFIGMLIGLWLLLMAYTAVFTAVGMNLRSSSGAIAVNICMASVLPFLLKAIDALFGVSISSFWIDKNITSILTMTPESGALVTGISIAAVYIIAAAVAGISVFRKKDIK